MVRIHCYHDFLWAILGFCIYLLESLHMTIPPRYREHLTGRARCRVQWLTRKAVLQVEVQQQYSNFWPGCPAPPGYDRAAWELEQQRSEAQSWRTTKTHYRDATPSEVLVACLFRLSDITSHRIT